jgi:predicted GNAT family N-acyltransferase
MKKDFIILPLDKTHKRSEFSCGVESLDFYFHKLAGQDSRKKVSVTYVLLDKKIDKVAGYYTLSATALELLAVPESVRKKLPSYPSLPATLIGRLAVDVAYRNKRLGEAILADALKKAYKTSHYVASFAVVVDAINKSAEKFYRKYGFLDLSVVDSRLFLPMSLIPEAIIG